MIIELLVDLDAKISRMIPIDGLDGCYTIIPLNTIPKYTDYKWPKSLPCVLLDNSK